MLKSASIHSIYMSNINKTVVDAQRKCVESVLPEDWEFIQHLTSGSHPDGLTKALEIGQHDITILLDIDCIPLSQRALTFLVENVVQENSDVNQGLVGPAQRANHINNNKHLYVGPFCMAFSREYYKKLGSPSFHETARGDVGEELTYCWTEKSGFLCQAGRNFYKYSSNVHFLWPFSVQEPLWELDFTWKFGIGTTYGAAGAGPYLFYHAFNARDPRTANLFLHECERMLAAQEAQKAHKSYNSQKVTA